MTFRSKLIIAMFLVVLLITGATVFTTHRQIQSAYNEIIQELFETQIRVFRSKQELRLENLKNECKNLAGSVRLFAALEEGEGSVIYQTAGDELRSLRGQQSFYRLLDPGGEVIAGMDERAGFIAPAAVRQLHGRLSMAAKGLLRGRKDQQVGYLDLKDSQGKLWLQEIIFTKIYSIGEGELVGVLVIGFTLTDFGEMGGSGGSKISSGILLNDYIFSNSIPLRLRGGIAQIVGAQILKNRAAPKNYRVNAGGISFRADYNLLNPESPAAPAYQISLYSLESMVSEQKKIMRRIILVGAAAMGVALILNIFLAHGLSGPIRKLVAGTKSIQEGNYEVKVPVASRDELGVLAESFNEMAEGLALKEKYRSVLNRVADKEVADQLMTGNIELGGETRPISVLFCDIRGFTALTQGMNPQEVVALLNEHMTALTKVVYEHKGVVDKFVGDLIMAIFGAPKSYENDALNAAACARQMILERANLNQHSKYKINVGIGVATGEALVGCMGSSDRLNYTVLGERVNLAARLCSKAAAGEVVIDEDTRKALGDLAKADLLESLQLKGFSEPVPAFRLLEIQPLKQL